MYIYILAYQIFTNLLYLIRWPNTVGLNVSPTGHFQTGSVLAVVFGYDDGVRRDRAVLLAEIILPESDLDRGAASADLGRHYLRRWFRRCQYRHLLLPHRLGAIADFRFRLNPEHIRLTRYKGLDNTSQIGRFEVLHLSMSRVLVKQTRIHVIQGYVLLQMYEEAT